MEFGIGVSVCNIRSEKQNKWEHGGLVVKHQTLNQEILDSTLTPGTVTVLGQEQLSTSCHSNPWNVVP